MAIGVLTDFKIYPLQVQTGFIERIADQFDVFNERTRGAISMITRLMPAGYTKEAFFQRPANIISRRDPASTAAATSEKVSQAEIATIKLNRRIGPFEQTLDSFRKIGAQADVNTLSFLLGQTIADAVLQEQTTTILRALRAALNGQATNKFTVATNGTLATLSLVSGLAKLGDAANQVGIWVMHSKPFFDLMADQITNYKLDSVAGGILVDATPRTMNRPVLVIDSDALIVTGGTSSAPTTDYHTLGLRLRAGQVEISEAPITVSEIVTGKENLTVLTQGEYAYNIGVTGQTWDLTNGGENPTDSAIGTGTNWDKVFASYKDLAGITIQSR